MKLCILGDTHFGARNDNPAFARFFEKFYTDIFFPTLEKEGIEYIIQMGDLFDRRKYINFVTLKESHRYFFEQVWRRGYVFNGLIGNHDTYYKNTNRVNSPQLLLGKYAERIHFHSQPVEVPYDVPILFVPWICDDNREQTLEHIQKTKCQVVVGHLELQGFEMYKGQKIHLENALTAKTFEKFDVVMSGHFHHRSKQGNITYVGTPYEITWSDFDDPKGFHIFDTKTRELTFIENPYKMFHKLHYDDVKKDVAEVCDVDFSPYKEAYVKIIVHNKTNPYCFDLYIDKLEKAGVFDVQVVDDHLHADKVSDEEITLAGSDTLSIINHSINQLDESVDKSKLEILMRDLYTEALKVE